MPSSYLWKTRRPARARLCAIGATALTDWANSGPMMSCAPSEIACCAAARAPSGVPRSSLTSTWMPAFWKSRMARSAALRRFCASCPALPVADSGSSSATRARPFRAFRRSPARWRQRSARCSPPPPPNPDEEHPASAAAAPKVSATAIPRILAVSGSRAQNSGRSTTSPLLALKTGGAPPGTRGNCPNHKRFPCTVKTS